MIGERRGGGVGQSERHNISRFFFDFFWCIFFKEWISLILKNTSSFKTETKTVLAHKCNCVFCWNATVVSLMPSTALRCNNFLSKFMALLFCLVFNLGVEEGFVGYKIRGLTWIFKLKYWNQSDGKQVTGHPGTL